MWAAVEIQHGLWGGGVWPGVKGIALTALPEWPTGLLFQKLGFSLSLRRVDSSLCPENADPAWRCTLDCSRGVRRTLPSGSEKA